MMAKVFIRLSVFWQNRQLDVSLPDSRPVADVINDIISLLGASDLDNPQPQDDVVGTPIWLLSSPKTGILNNEATLSDYKILDGDKLYLTKRTEAAHSPFVDDVMSEVRNSISDNQWRWSGEPRRKGLFTASILLTTLLYFIALWRVIISPERLTNWTASDWFFSGVASSVTLLFTVLSLWQPQLGMRWLSFTIPISTTVVSYPFLTAQPAAIELGCLLAIATFSSIPVAFISGRKKARNGLAGGIALFGITLVAIIVVICNIYGVSALALVAWSSWLPIAILLIAPSIAVRTSGLAALLRRNDSGDSIARSDIQVYAARATALCDSLVWFATGLGLLVSLTLVSSPYWQQGICGAIVAVILLFRSNGFSDARLITPLILSGCLSLAVTAGSVSYWITHRHATPTHVPWWTQFGESAITPWVVSSLTFLVLVLILIALQAYTPHEVQEARSASIISAVDTIFSITAIPLILVAQGVLTYLWATR